MAAHVELYADQGTTFNNTITLTDDTTNTAINLVGYSASSQMRRSYYSTNASANITCTITDASNGVIIMSLPAGITSNLRPGFYLFDLETIDDVGDVSRVLEGSITINPGVTR
jgi:hypothetical protein